MIKKIVLLAVLAAALRLSGLLPFESSDVAELVPVRALVVCMQAEKVVLDGGDCHGVGADWNSAWEDLHSSADGHVFLGTADHVVLCGNAVSLLPQVASSRELRPAASVCVCPDSVPDAEEAADYLDAHDGGVTLQQVRALQLRAGTVQLPQLMQTEGGLRLSGTNHR